MERSWSEDFIDPATMRRTSNINYASGMQDDRLGKRGEILVSEKWLNAEIIRKIDANANLSDVLYSQDKKNEF